MIRIVIFSFCLLIFTWITPVLGQASNSYTVTVDKSPSPSGNIRKWSLQEFLDTKDRMRLMDLWLALHTPKPYEFFINADARFVNGGPTGFPLDTRLSFTAFSYIFGLSVEKEAIPSRVNLLFLLRVFGFREQATHLTFHFGLRNQSEPAFFRSAFLGLTAALYFTRYFGFEGVYRHYYPSVPSISGAKFEGNHLEANGFIDFKALRIFGGYLKQYDDFTDRTGLQAGLRVFF